MLRMALVAFLLGVMCGVTVAGCELGVLAVAGKGIPCARLAFPMMCIYAALGGLAGAAIGTAGAAYAYARKKKVDGVKWASLCTAIQLGCFISLEIGLIGFKRFSPSYPYGLIIALLVCLAMAVAATMLFHSVFLRLFGGSGPGHARRRRVLFPAVAVFCAILAGITGAVTYAPARLSSGQMPAAGNTGRPDIFMIVVDAMRPDHMSAYGYDRDTTPAMSDVAKSGAMFLNARSQSSWTKPAVASILTSHYPSGHGVWDLEDILSLEAVTLPEILKGEGYNTAVFSANVLISPQFGFGDGVDVIVVPDYSAVGHFSAAGYALNRVSGRLGGPFRALWHLTATIELALRGERRDATEYTAGQINSAVIDWARSAGDAPLFAYIHYMEPHASYDPPPPFDSLFLPPGDSGPRVSRPPKDQNMLFPFEAADSLCEDDEKHLIAAYDGEIACADESVGDLVNQLTAIRGGNAIVVLTADHGEEFYEHRGWEHGLSLFDEVLRVPLIFSWTGHITGGARIAGLVRHIDILPTLLDLCGIDSVQPVCGATLAPVLLGDLSEAHVALSLSELRRVWDRDVFAVQSDSVKLVVARKGNQRSVMLFDLLNDPGELRDVSGMMPQKTDSMLALATALLYAARADGQPGETATITSRTLKILKTLGYTD